ncbi:threonine/serine exporter family protein [Peptostreptococcus anaerobius]|uniref:threonine/serine exporter family protein n=1 Tax=Peptostreptococcus anaerobius TaxID=1261 RepID=UPI001D075405|nr:threonine/serine exporter family protein [Peptostreptococcus anaerobius]MCB6983322.1 threonine/serine exporter family protein [Peptostreptococcus anaerobius]MCQ5151197.1 threonine/serine exporter family protein [Peptostreptococcus anaerobius]
MMNIPIWEHFLFAAMATCGFSIFFNAPKKLLLPSSVVGGVGWIIYLVMSVHFDNPLVYAFTAAIFIAVSSEIFARLLKQPAIVIIIPGILPLVPGISLYNTVLYTIQKKYELAASTGTRAIIVSIGISLGILVVASLSRMFNIYKLKKAFSSNDSNKYISWVNIGKIRTNNTYVLNKAEMNDQLNSMNLEDIEKDECKSKPENSFVEEEIICDESEKTSDIKNKQDSDS